MKRTDKIAAVPVLLNVLQSNLWYNDKYKAFFSKHHTNNPQEYWSFFLDIKSGVRKHGVYRLTTDGILVHFLKKEYKVKELTHMRTYNIIMIQTTDSTNELDYTNWMGTTLPAEKGKPYVIGR